MSFYKVMAGLEDFADQVNAEIVQPQPTDGDFDEPVAGVDFTEESDAIDDDVDSVIESAQGLEDIISLINDAPGDETAPMEPFVAKAVNVALESNDMVATSGNPLDGSDDKTKKGAADKIKEFAAKVWAMLRNFGKRIATWIRESWAKYTDRIVKNSARAKKILAEEANLATASGAKITDKSLLAKIATAQDIDVGDVVLAAYEFAEEQGNKDSIGLTKAANHCIDLVARGASNSDGVMEDFLKAITASLGSYEVDASPAQARAVPGSAAGTSVKLGKPLFAGFRAWTVVPDDQENLKLWNHGISKIDKVKVKDSIDAPDAQEIKAIAQYVIDMSKLVAVYQSNLKELDSLNKELDKAAAKVKGQEGETDALKQMQAVIPRVIKGPQVAAYAYATSASTIALQYCEAAIRAHKGGEEKPAETDKA